DGQPSAVMRLRLLTPQAFADRMVSFAGERLVSEAVRSVETVSPELSARMGPARWQISALIASAAAGIAFAALAPGSALSVVLAVFSVFFLALGALRLTAVGLALTENGNDD